MDTALDQPVAKIGDNMPPAGVDPLLERLTGAHSSLIERRDALLAGIKRAPEKIEDEATAGKMADFVSLQIDKFLKNAKIAHQDEKEPYLSGGRTVDGFWHSLIDEIEAGKKALNKVRKSYADAKAAAERRVRDEGARLAREEETRKRREAEKASAAAETEADLAAAVAREEEAIQASKETTAAEKAAAAKPAELGRTRGEYGGMTTLKQFWNFKDVERGDLDLEALRQHLSTAALEGAVRSWINANKDALQAGARLTGVNIFEDTRL